MVTGSGISEKEKGNANVGLTEIVVNAAIDIPAKNSFIIAPPCVTQICAFGLRKDGLLLKGCRLPIFPLKIDTPEFRQYTKQD
jgi:hypothetical protein